MILKVSESSVSDSFPHQKHKPSSRREARSACLYANKSSSVDIIVFFSSDCLYFLVEFIQLQVTSEGQNEKQDYLCKYEDTSSSCDGFLSPDLALSVFHIRSVSCGAETSTHVRFPRWSGPVSGFCVPWATPRAPAHHAQLLPHSAPHASACLG